MRKKDKYSEDDEPLLLLRFAFITFFLCLITDEKYIKTLQKNCIMGTKIEYVDSSHLYATNYIRNSKAIAVLWSIFSICYAIISIVAYVTPGEIIFLID